MYLPEADQAAPSEFIELYSINLTKLNGGEELIFNFTDSLYPAGSAIVFNSVAYLPLPCTGSGFDVSSSGALPNPSLTISNVNSIFTPYLQQFNNCEGALITYTKTHRAYLDGQEKADPTRIYPFDVYQIERCSQHNYQMIKFELSSLFDLQNKNLPGMIVNGNCQHVYRKYVDGAFVAGTCPWAGTTYFDGNDNPCAIQNDSCSHLESGCGARFGNNNVLPMLGFPAIQTMPGT